MKKVESVPGLLSFIVEEFFFGEHKSPKAGVTLQYVAQFSYKKNLIWLFLSVI